MGFNGTRFLAKLFYNPATPLGPNTHLKPPLQLMNAILPELFNHGALDGLSETQIRATCKGVKILYRRSLGEFTYSGMEAVAIPSLDILFNNMGEHYIEALVENGEVEIEEYETEDEEVAFDKRTFHVGREFRQGSAVGILLIPKDEVKGALREYEPNEDEDQLALEMDIDRGAMGCLGNDHRLEAALYRLPKLWAPPATSQSYDCFIQCLVHALDLIDHIYPKSLRDFYTQYNIPIGRPLEEELIDAIVQGEQRFMIVILEIQATIPQHLASKLKYQSKTEVSHTIQEVKRFLPIGFDYVTHFLHQITILRHKGHCYHVGDPVLLLKKEKCSTCTQWINKSSFPKHAKDCYYCSTCRKLHREPDHQCPGESGRRPNPKELKENILFLYGKGPVEWQKIDAHPRNKKLNSKKKLWFADIEAFCNPHTDSFTPYAIGLQCLDDIEEGKPEIFYGRDCEERFLRRLLEIEGIIHHPHHIRSCIRSSLLL